jgi:hypothetical protein
MLPKTGTLQIADHTLAVTFVENHDIVGQIYYLLTPVFCIRQKKGDLSVSYVKNGCFNGGILVDKQAYRKRGTPF